MQRVTISSTRGQKLSQILANNIDNGGRGIGLRIYVRYCGFTVYIKAEDIETYIEIETNLDTLNYKLDGPLPRRK